MNDLDLVKAIKFLKPTAQFSFIDNDFNTIKWDYIEGDTPTLKELEDALKIANKLEQEAEKNKIAARQAILDRLGLTEEEAKLLLS